MMRSKVSKDSSRGFQVNSEISFLISVRKTLPTSSQSLDLTSKMIHICAFIAGGDVYCVGPVASDVEACFFRGPRQSGILFTCLTSQERGGGRSVFFYLGLYYLSWAMREG